MSGIHAFVIAETVLRKILIKISPLNVCTLFISAFSKLSIYETERGKNLQKQKPRFTRAFSPSNAKIKTLIVEFRRATRRETNTLDEIK